MFRTNNAYLDILMNEHLTSFKISSYCFFPKLEDDTSGEEIPSNNGDEFLERISKCCPRIVKIDASNINCTDEGIQFLCETENGMLPCPELKEIKIISKDSITDKGAECFIRSLPLLERFNYPYLPRVLHSVHTRNSTESHTFNLTKLDLRPCKDMSNLAEIIKSCLTVCPKLQSINCHLSEKEQLDELSNSHLKKLGLVLSRIISNINIDYFLKVCGRYLKYLKLHNGSVTASSVAVHCTILEKLEILNVHFADDDDAQPNFPSLTSCDFLEMSTTVKAFLLLSSSSPKLESIAFSNCVLCSETKKEILMWCKSPAAKNICFSFVQQLEIEFLRKILLHCCSLKCMRLIGCSYNVPNPYKELSLLAEKLSNKPGLEISKF